MKASHKRQMRFETVLNKTELALQRHLLVVIFQTKVERQLQDVALLMVPVE
jgi:hypothetical protein